MMGFPGKLDNSSSLMLKFMAKELIQDPIKEGAISKDGSPTEPKPRSSLELVSE